MNRSGRIALVVALGVGALAAAAPALQESKKGREAAPASQAATPEQRLAQAKLVADGEHDPERALTLLTALAADAGVSSEVRAQAFVAAARCLNQLGRNDEAKLQLQAAAKLNGPGADEAKHLLDAGLTDQQLELRIAKAIDELLNFQTNKDDSIDVIAKLRVAQDLIWVGAPAVPRLVRILADVDHLYAVTRVTYILASINTDEAAAAVRDALKKADPFYKRAVLAAFRPNTMWTDPIRAAVMTLLNDSDAHVRQWVLSDVARLARIEEILPLTHDPDDAVRKGAWQAIRSKDQDDLISDVEPLVAALRRCLKEDRDEIRLVAVEMLRSTRLLQCDAGRALYTETLLDPVLTAPVSGSAPPRWLRALESMNQNFDRPVPIDLLLLTAEKLGTVEIYGADGPTRSITVGVNTFGLLVQKSSYAVIAGKQPGWPAEERAKVWRLLRFGVGGWIGNWIAANVSAEDLPEIAENAAAAGDVTSITIAFRRPGVKLAPAQRSAVAKSLLHLFDRDTSQWEKLATKPANTPQRWFSTVSLLAALGDDEADRAVVKAQAMVPGTWLLPSLLNRNDPLVDPKRLVDLVTIPTLPGSDQERTRNAALGRIAAAHLPELPNLLARCYELGLFADSEGGPSGGRSRLRGFAWMVAREPDPKDSTAKGRGAAAPRSTGSRNPLSPGFRADWDPSYSAADLRVAFETCARVDNGQFWWDVTRALDLLPDEGPFDPVATAFLELIMENVATLPDELLQQAGAKRIGLVYGVLRRHTPGWKEFSLAHCLEGELGEAIVVNVPEVTPEVLQVVMDSRADATVKCRALLVQRLPYEKDESLRQHAVDFLQDPSGEVRRKAVDAVFAVAPDRALDLLLPLAKDSNSGVRAALYAGLVSTFDRRAIPILVDGLQDPAAGNREIAKKSLDSIQYVFEQKDKWRRMLDSAGLDSTNAAEALVKQAAATQPKATRLIAIESLGTLGVAETLPVLITFMGEKDAEIAAAAKTAVERINRRTAEKESAPAGKSPPAKGQ